MELRHLRYFVAVAEELNFRAAAKRLFISQPPLSLQIQQLEQELGTELFDRSQRRVALTASGRLFLDHARSVLHEVAEAKIAVAHGAGGQIRIAFTRSTEFMPFLADAVRDFRTTRPDARLDAREMTSAAQIDAIVEGDLDVAIVREQRLGQRGALVYEELCQDDLIVAMPRDHALTKTASIAVAELSEHPLICTPKADGSGLRQLVMELFWSARVTPKVAYEARDLSTIIWMVSAGLGVAVLPEGLRAVALKGVHFAPLVVHGAKMKLFALSHRQPRNELTLPFIHLLKKHVTQRVDRV